MEKHAKKSVTIMKQQTKKYSLCFNFFFQIDLYKIKQKVFILVYNIYNIKILSQVFHVFVIPNVYEK